MEKMSIVSLVLNASVVVQVVMGLLVLASVLSWVVIFQRYFFLRGTRNSFRRFENEFHQLDGGYIDLYRQCKANPTLDSGAERIFIAGVDEYRRLIKQGGANSEAVMEGAERAMRVALAREEATLELHLPFLASVGSVSPYVGLFGTVWGIMNSFRGLANTQQATLASVAPGISEALIATAIGLFAAIPAVLAYNRFSSLSETIMSDYDTFAEDVLNDLHRRIHAAA